MTAMDKRIPLSTETVLSLHRSDGSSESFRILECVGLGGSCIVYKAVRYTEFANEIVETSHIIKEYYPYGMNMKRSGTELICDEPIRRKFEQRMSGFEQGGAAYAKLYQTDTLHILPPPELLYANNTEYLVSDIHEGKTLDEYKEIHRMKDIMGIMKSICEAIMPFHENGYLYLDIKPSNIFVYELDGSVHVKFFDFDTVIKKEEISSKQYSPRYSPGWAAPEQENGQTKLISEKTDIYALGHILFYLITNRKAVSAGPKSDLKKIANDQFDWSKYLIFSRCYGANLKRSILDILKHSLTVSPSVRFDSAEQLYEKINQIYKTLTDHTVDLGDGRYYRLDRNEDGSVYTGNFLQDVKDGPGEFMFASGIKLLGEWKNDILHGNVKYEHPSGIRYEGGWKNNTFDGQGTMIWPDGTEYTGKWCNGHRDGDGRMTWPDGTYYQGAWQNGNRNGKGVMHYADGTVSEGLWTDGKINGIIDMRWADRHHYHGSFSNGKRNGFGRMDYPDSRWYEGDWKDDIKDGRGTYYYAEADALYTGDFHDGVRDGYGEITFPDGEYFAGSWENDQRSGYGLVKYPGDRICGAVWKESKRNGQGTISWPNGAYYIGDWKDDKPDGRGYYYYHDGTVYDGNWLNGNRHGTGTMIWPDGAVYEGHWADNERNGEGKLINSDGWIYEGNWLNDKLHGKGKRISPSFLRVDICEWENGTLINWHTE